MKTLILVSFLGLTNCTMPNSLPPSIVKDLAEPANCGELYPEKYSRSYYIGHYHKRETVDCKKDKTVYDGYIAYAQALRIKDIAIVNHHFKIEVYPDQQPDPTYRLGSTIEVDGQNCKNLTCFMPIASLSFSMEDGLCFQHGIYGWKQGTTDIVTYHMEDSCLTI